MRNLWDSMTGTGAPGRWGAETWKGGDRGVGRGTRVFCGIHTMSTLDPLIQRCLEMRTEGKYVVSPFLCCERGAALPDSGEVFDCCQHPLSGTPLKTCCFTTITQVSTGSRNKSSWGWAEPFFLQGQASVLLVGWLTAEPDWWKRAQTRECPV